MGSLLPNAFTVQAYLRERDKVPYTSTKKGKILAYCNLNFHFHVADGNTVDLELYGVKQSLYLFGS